MSEIGDIAERKLRDRAREQAGVLLPEIDVTIGEMLLNTIYANPNVGLADVIMSLVLTAPKEMASEFVRAGIQLALCHQHGKLYWLDAEAQSILVGIRGTNLKSSIMVGNARWPMKALLSGPPQVVTIGLTDRREAVWMACDGLDGAVVRMSEVIGLAQLMVEAFGARVIEDRHGPDVMRQSYIEKNMSVRAQRLAEARGAMDRLTITRTSDPRGEHARVAMAESLPGTLKDGDRVVMVEDPTHVFEVDRRINEDYVLVVSIDKKSAVAAGQWRYEDNRRMPGMSKDVEEMFAGVVGFTDDDAKPYAGNQPPSPPEPEGESEST